MSALKSLFSEPDSRFFLKAPQYLPTFWEEGWTHSNQACQTLHCQKSIWEKLQSKAVLRTLSKNSSFLNCQLLMVIAVISTFATLSSVAAAHCLFSCMKSPFHTHISPKTNFYPNLSRFIDQSAFFYLARCIRDRCSFGDLDFSSLGSS